mmetsp:Transcript_5237/g.12764  ORF Transcript_5237/g.12764 Transcript_5237/m.12764 type:complete len:302 (+) Transcript_5237:1076-1981(+)
MLSAASPSTAARTCVLVSTALPYLQGLLHHSRVRPLPRRLPVAPPLLRSLKRLTTARSLSKRQPHQRLPPVCPLRPPSLPRSPEQEVSGTAWDRRTAPMRSASFASRPPAPPAWPPRRTRTGSAAATGRTARRNATATTARCSSRSSPWTAPRRFQQIGPRGSGPPRRRQQCRPPYTRPSRVRCAGGMRRTASRSSASTTTAVTSGRSAGSSARRRIPAPLRCTTRASSGSAASSPAACGSPATRTPLFCSRSRSPLSRRRRPTSSSSGSRRGAARSHTSDTASLASTTIGLRGASTRPAL